MTGSLGTPGVLVVHYAEVALKGKNRVFFLGMLKRNLHRTLEGCPTREIRSLAGRLIVDFGRPLTTLETTEIVRRIRNVPGVAHFAFCEEVAERDLTELEARVVALARTRVGMDMRSSDEPDAPSSEQNAPSSDGPDARSSDESSARSRDEPTAPSSEPNAPSSEPTAPSSEPTAPSSDEPTAPSSEPNAPSSNAPGGAATERAKPDSSAIDHSNGVSGVGGIEVRASPGMGAGVGAIGTFAVDAVGVSGSSSEESARRGFPASSKSSTRHPTGSGRPPNSFCVASHRSDKSYALTSIEMNRRLGGAVQAATGLRVDLDHPDLTLHVEILGDRFLYYGDRTSGPGGLPIGSSGRVLALLSAGIDSPVAAYRMMLRGCRVFYVHFHSLPYTQRGSLDLAEELVRHLSPYQPSARLQFVALAEIQRKIVAEAPAPLRVVLYRRMMLRLAAWMAKRARAKALVTGESLGQVASQTLENLVAIEDACPMPVLRPLIGMSKDEIIAEARRLGTYEISIQPYDDCCAFLMPEHPETRASLEEVRAAEERLGDLSDLMRNAVNNAQVIRIGGGSRTPARIRE